MTYLSDPLPLIQVNQVDRKFHEEGVYRFARSNPQPFPRLQSFARDKPSTPLGAGICDISGGYEERVAGVVPDAYAHRIAYRPGLDFFVGKPSLPPVP